VPVLGQNSGGSHTPVDARQSVPAVQAWL
jgi:hypothetical protein